jgi:tetratricopeptide (TPR) repeat protein
MKLPSALLAVTLVIAPSALLASGSSAMRLPPPTSKLTPEQEAISLYNDGIAYRDKAAKLEAEAAAEPDARKKEKLLAKAKDKHEDSIKKFMDSTKKNARLYGAWGSLGYAYRKVGNYPASLEAYGKALEIEPNYTPAIEYRAEAYLALNRLDDVKSVYITLFRIDRPRADELSAAIEKWIEKRKSDPAGLDPAQVDEFAKWAADRKQLASQVSSLTSPRHAGW